MKTTFIYRFRRTKILKSQLGGIYLKTFIDKFRNPNYS